MPISRRKKQLVVGTLVALALVLTALDSMATAAEPGEAQTRNGLTVYLGVVPAEIVKGPAPHSAEQPMHGRIPRGPHEYHVVAAIFDAATGARMSDASVTAQVSGTGLSGSSKKLEAMQIAGTTSYGAFFSLPGRDLYKIRLTVEDRGAARPIIVDFKYDHRR